MKTLYPFQRQGNKFFLDHIYKRNGITNSNCILGDEMGLGKTDQVVTALVDSDCRSSLIICPKIVKQGWRLRMLEWGISGGDDRIFIVETGNDVIPIRANHIIVNYDLAVNSKIKAQLLQREFGVINLDEIQRLKSPNSKRTVAIFKNFPRKSIASRAHAIFGTSGTLTPNRPIEMYLPVKCMASEILDPYNTTEEFGKRFCSGFKDGRDWNFKGASNLDDLGERLSRDPFLLQRSMQEVLPDLPPVISTDLFFDIGTLPGGEDETNTQSATLRRLIGEHKLSFVMDYVISTKFIEQGIEKLVLFAYHKSVIDAGLSCLFSNNIKAASIDGRVSSAERQARISDFINGTTRVLFCQHQAAGEAVDGLQFVCCDMLDIEPDWSPGAENQIVGRLKRIGQSRPVRFERAIAENTFDDIVVGTQWSKRKGLNKLNFHINFGLVDYKNNEVNINMSLENSLERIAVALEKLSAIGFYPPAGAPVVEQKSESKADKKGKAADPKNQIAPAAETPSGESANVASSNATTTPATATTIAAMKLDDVRESALLVLNEVYGGSAEGKQMISELAVKPFGATELAKLKPEFYMQAKMNLDNHRKAKLAPTAPVDALCGV